MDNISIIGKACCGCRACEQSCHKHAIVFKEDEEGFLQPYVDQDECVNCGKCLKACPIHTVYVCHEKQTGYAAKTASENDLKECSSGGLFYEMAKYVFDQKGVVCGCGIDDSLMPHHVIANSLEEAKQLRGSKYVQSSMGNIYTQIKEYLDKGVIILFTGVPCQVAGLKNFLSNDYSNLYCVDIICHGVPSRKLYAAYLKWLSEKYGEISSVEFRSKKRHQWSLTLNVRTNNDGRIQEHLKIASLDPYYYNFLEGNTYRESCYTCPYSQNSRPGDITIGDFWGIENIHPELFDIRGVSCALVNSEKGQNLWAGIESGLDATEVKLSDIINYYGNLRQPTKRKPIRDIVYQRLNEKGFEAIPYDLSLKSRAIDSLKNFIPNGWRYRIKTMLKR